MMILVKNRQVKPGCFVLRGYCRPFNKSDTGVKKHRAGFTLAELLLASAIFAFALTGLLALFTASILLNKASRNLSIALTHSQYVMEDIKNTSFVSVSPKITAGDWDWDNAEIGVEGLSVLTNENIDTEIISGSPADPLEVNVRIIWQDPGGRNREINLCTAFTDE